MSYSLKVITSCDWCLQAKEVEKIEPKLFSFWLMISDNIQDVVPRENICKGCKSRYEKFSMFIKKHKRNGSSVEEENAMNKIREEIETYEEEIAEFSKLIEKESLEEEMVNCDRPAVSNVDLLVDNLKYFKCIYCDRSFTRLSCLEAHLGRHEVERPYKCPLCGRLFSQFNDLDIHLQIHINEN